MKHFILLLLLVFTTVIASEQVKVSIVTCPQINESFGAHPINYGELTKSSNNLKDKNYE